jgi:hypothetical protein
MLRAREIKQHGESRAAPSPAHIRVSFGAELLVFKQIPKAILALGVDSASIKEP